MIERRQDAGILDPPSERHRRARLMRRAVTRMVNRRGLIGEARSDAVSVVGADIARQIPVHVARVAIG